MTGIWGTDMKALWIEIVEKTKSKWFLVSAVLTSLTLWLGMGAESSRLLHGVQYDSHWLIEISFTAKLQLIALPLLSTLPASATARREIACGVVRNILFRCGMKEYVFSRTATLVIMSILPQFVGITGFIALLYIFTDRASISVTLIVARILCAALFAIVGSFGALVTKDSVCAYVLPVVICFSLSMLRSRFLIEAEFLDPLCWLSGSCDMLTMLLVLLGVMLCGYIVFIYYEVRRSV